MPSCSTIRRTVSVHANRVGGYDVRWRDASGKARSKSFRRNRDAERYDLAVKDAKALGTLAGLDSDTISLDGYVAGTWAPVHVATLAAGTSGSTRSCTPATSGRGSAATSCASSPRRSSAAGRPTASPPVRRRTRCASR
jgi:hypothetical protein